MPAMSKKAIVIGESTLCVQCIEHLLHQRWEIIQILSDDQAVVNFAKDHFIPVSSTAELGAIKQQNFYLFSIVNHCLIPKSFFQDKKTISA